MASLPPLPPTYHHHPLPRIVLPSLPVVYGYDACPFAIRVRFTLGVKNIKYKLVIIANDDIATPTSLIGKVMVPILHFNNVAMGESLDIIARIDNDPTFGPVNCIQPASGRSELLKNIDITFNKWNNSLLYPRYMRTLLPEFNQLDSRMYFMSKRAVGAIDPAVWAEMSHEDRVAKYNEVHESSKGLIEEVTQHLETLDSIIYSSECCSEGGISYDDVMLFPRLRAMTMVKGIQWPSKLRAYLDRMSELSDIPLYDILAN
jgi:GrxB family glutaredoxin